MNNASKGRNFSEGEAGFTTVLRLSCGIINFNHAHIDSMDCTEKLFGILYLASGGYTHAFPDSSKPWNSNEASP